MIGPAIKWHLERNGCSFYKIAARLGVNRCVITKLVKQDSNPTYYTICRVAKALGICPSDIIKKAVELEGAGNEK